MPECLISISSFILRMHIFFFVKVKVTDCDN